MQCTSDTMGWYETVSVGEPCCGACMLCYLERCIALSLHTATTVCVEGSGGVKVCHVAAGDGRTVAAEVTVLAPINKVLFCVEGGVWRVVCGGWCVEGGVWRVVCRVVPEIEAHGMQYYDRCGLC